MDDISKEKYEEMISRWVDTKKEKYEKLKTYLDRDHEFWVVYVAEIGPNNYAPLDLSKILAFSFIHLSPKLLHLPLPIVSLKKEPLPCGLEG